MPFILNNLKSINNYMNLSNLRIIGGVKFTWDTVGQGLLSIWGNNSYGLANYFGNGYTWSNINITEFSGMIRSDGKLFTWGRNNYGQLGDGTTDNKSYPVQIGSSSWIAISFSTTNAALGIRSDGMLFTWGRNNYGQLGDGTTVNKSSPVQIGSSSWTAVSTGQGNSIALRSDGLLFTWGRNNYGQLGDGTTISKSSPVQIGSSSWIAVSSGGGHCLAIRSGGTLFTWGRNNYGQLGVNDFTSRSSPVLVSSGWSQIAGGGLHSVGINSNGTIYTWGNGIYGQMGDNTQNSRPNPGLLYVTFSSSSWTAIGAGNFTTFGIRNDGTLYGWGRNNDGQLGVNNGFAVNQQPVRVLPPYQGSWTSITKGLSAANGGGILNGQPYFWGRNDYYQITPAFWAVTPPTITSSVPVQIPFTSSLSSPIAVSSSWSSISVGNNFVAAIQSDKKLYAWGRNNYGQLGDNTTITRSSPVQIGSSSWLAVSSGAYSTAAIRSDGLLFTWGRNTSAQLGDGTTVNKSSPVQIGSSSWTLVNSGINNTFAISTDGKLFGCGNPNLMTVTEIKSWAVLGDPYTTFLNITSDNKLWWCGGAIGSSPTLVGLGTQNSTWKAASNGNAFWSIIRTDGILFAWGLNNQGQVGDGTFITRNSPVQIGSSSWTAIKNGLNYCLALRSNNLLFGWGYNNQGQLGDGTTIRKTSPIQIGSSSWIAVDTGWSHTVAIRSDGMLFAWGSASGGQLGNGSTISRSSPVQIGSSSWIAVSAGGGSGDFSVAIRSDGMLFAWGRNGYGQLGDGTTVNKSSPVQIGSSSWIAISAGPNSFTFAIRSGGTLFSWGNNSQGQLGDGTTVNKSSPVQIGGSNSWIAVQAWQASGSAIDSNNNLYTWGDNSSGQLGLQITGVFGSKVTVPTLVGGQAFAYTQSNLLPIGSDSWKNIKLGASHAVAIRHDNLLFTWGLNSSGQLGTGDTTTRSSPVQIGSSNWIAVDAGISHTVAIREDNLLFSWGTNSYGQLGTWYETNYIDVGLKGIAIGRPIHVIRNDGILFGWGINSGNYGLIGDGTLDSRSSPVQIGSSSWTLVSGAGSNLIGAIRSDGILFGWGRYPGDGTSIIRSSPVQIGSSSWIALSVGSSHALAISSDNKLFSWGNNNSGQLGDGTLITKLSPVQIGSSNWTSISAGYAFSAAIRSDGMLFSWGNNSQGQLGDGTNISKSSPVQIGSSSWIAINGGYSTMIGIRSGGTLFTWGYGTFGRLGDGTTISKSSPVQIGSSSWIAVPKNVAGRVNAAIRSDGMLFTWGQNNYGQLGDGTMINRSSPVQIGSNSWVSISMGYISIGLTTDNRLYIWGGRNGSNFNWQPVLGTPKAYNSPIFLNSFVPNSSPVQVGSSSWLAISAGSRHTSGILKNTERLGQVFSWGDNRFGQLGDGTTNFKPSPIQISSTYYKNVDSGYDSTSNIKY